MGEEKDVVKEQEKTDEYDKAWDEWEKGAKPEKPGDEVPAKEPEKSKDETQVVPPKTDDTPVAEQNAQEKPADEPRSERYGSIQSMEKALDDTKRYAHRLEAEKAELKKKLEELEKGQATQSDVDLAKQKVKDAQTDLDAIRKQVYNDYPELEPLIDGIIMRSQELEQKLATVERLARDQAKRSEREKAVEHFNTHVKPEIVKVHKDFDEIVQSVEYWDWAERQRPALKTAAMDSPDPQDIIWAITEFKKFVAGPDIQNLRDKDKQAKTERLVNAQAMLRGGGGAPPMPKQQEDDSSENYWEWAGEMLKKQGIG